MATRGSGDLVVNDLRGGMNNQDSPQILPDTQSVLAQNVEYFISTLGERRKGMAAVDLTGSVLSGKTVIVHLAPWTPVSNDLSTSELFGLAATPGVSVVLDLRDAGYNWAGGITMSDTPDNSEPNVYKMNSISIHGKWYLCYNNTAGVARQHLWDGTSFRRAGVAAPTAAPTAADTGSGTFGVDDHLTPRIYRVRLLVQDSNGKYLRRSEPSPTVTWTPSGTGSGILVTRPAGVGEGETHWELEASDGDGNFYIIATTLMATTTYTDTNDPATSYANFVLSEPVGEYELIESCQFVIGDEDRVIFGGSWNDPTHRCRISWTPVSASPGVGNDERLPTDINSFIDLDWMDGGNLTGMSSSLNGSFYAFKLNRIYKIQRTGILNNAYESYLLSKERGALYGSVVNGVDEYGRGCVYFLDPSIGPMRIGSNGIQQMQNIRGTWFTVNTSATKIVTHGVYYPDKQQLKWWLATAASNTPNFRVSNQVNHIASDSTGGGGTQGCWTVDTGHITEAYCSCVFPETVLDPDTGAVYLSMRPYAGFLGPDFVQRLDVGFTDNAIPYQAVVLTKPYIVAGLLDWWGARVGGLLAKPITDPTVLMDVSFIRDFGLETNTVTTAFVPDSNESLVIKRFDNLRMSNSHVIQVQFADTNTTAVQQIDPNGP